MSLVTIFSKYIRTAVEYKFRLSFKLKFLKNKIFYIIKTVFLSHAFAKNIEILTFFSAKSA